MDSRRPPPSGQPHRDASSEGSDTGSKSPAASSALGSRTPTEAGHGEASAAAGPDPAPVSSRLSSFSGHSDRQQDHSDRVFPIRSAISVDPPGRTSGEHDYFSKPMSKSSYPTPGIGRADTGGQGRRRSTEAGESGQTAPIMSPDDRSRRRRQNPSAGAISSIQADATRHGTVGPVPIFADEPSEDEQSDGGEAPTAGQASAGSGEDGTSSGITPEGLMTVRFRHAVTDEGHAVITGREGTLQRCEDEPIHAPGAVQGFGLLVAIREEPDGCFPVRYVSENSERLIGYSPRYLFRLGNFLDILTEEQADNLLDHIDFIRDEDADPAVQGPEVFTVSIRPPKKRSVKFWCAIHIQPAHPDLVICEFELDDDHDNPLRPSDELTPDIPEDTLHANPTLEELTESTEILSKPLRVLRSARKRRGEAGAMQVFDIMSQVQEQLASAPTLDKFLKIMVGIVKELTGFHRVMVYQFDSSFNGRVVTELVDPIHTRDLYKGLHFPASDIPRQARDLYKTNKVRILYDRDLETARIVCRAVEDLETPLDMTHAYLRAMSPIHLKYLGNMAVRSSMSISINAFGELWGLIACHSYGPKGMRVPFPIRKMCRLVGDTVSRIVERLSYASRLQARKLINTIPTDKNPSGYIIASSDDLLKLFDADFGMLSVRGETKILGRLEHTQEALAMLEYLRVRKFTSVITTQDIRTDFPDLRYPPGFLVIAGLLYVPLSVGGNDFIVFFRKGQIREVKWAGNPYEKVTPDGTAAYLEPRKSFKTWHETVDGKCREWTEAQVETAAVLCLVYGKFIEVWRQKEAAIHSSRLTRLLLTNSTHEVRTPLNAIINYLEIALEGTLDQETRDNLARSHSASKSLIYVINDLLDLTKTEEGQGLAKNEIFDLPRCIREATEPFKNEAKRKRIQYEVMEHPGLPRYVYGDERKIRQAVANLTANAVQHTDQGSVKIELYSAEVQDGRVRIEIVVQDTGQGMTDAQIDALFRELENVTRETDEEGPFGELKQEVPNNAKTLGLGLAVVARIVRNMDGQLRLKSAEGKGSRFVIQLPFGLPADESPDLSGAMSNVASNASLTTTRPPSFEGEVLLVDGGGGSGSSQQHGPLSEKKGPDDTHSVSSLRSGTSKGSHHSNKSDADRLIDAIQTPLALGEPEPQRARLQRRHSKGPYYNTNAESQGSAARSRSPRREGNRPATSPEKPSKAETELARHDDAPAGMQYVADSKTPIKPVKIPEDYKDQPDLPQSSASSRVLFEIPDKSRPARTSSQRSARSIGSGREAVRRGLQVLIAEDDPINFKILSKRLEKAGHKVSHAVNGEDCAQMYSSRSKDFDVILMDMQMPIVDGLSSTKMIRAFEQSSEQPGLSRAAANHGHIPILAVSASLVEHKKDTYVDAGFDSWILKPIDFKRLETLLSGITDDRVRNECLYHTGEWERGGWFRRRTEPAGPEKGASSTSAPPEDDGPGRRD